MWVAYRRARRLHVFRKTLNPRVPELIFNMYKPQAPKPQGNPSGATFRASARRRCGNNFRVSALGLLQFRAHGSKMCMHMICIICICRIASTSASTPASRSISISVSVSVLIYTCTGLYVSICLPVCLSACLSVCLCVCLSVCLSV